jgi:hypothetical protein
MHHRYQFVGPDGVAVDVEVIRQLSLARPACAQEPADVGIVRTELLVNDVPAPPERYPDLVQFVEEYGRRLS